MSEVFVGVLDGVLDGVLEGVMDIDCCFTGEIISTFSLTGVVIVASGASSVVIATVSTSFISLLYSCSSSLSSPSSISSKTFLISNSDGFGEGGLERDPLIPLRLGSATAGVETDLRPSSTSSPASKSFGLAIGTDSDFSSLSSILVSFSISIRASSISSILVDSLD